MKNNVNNLLDLRSMLKSELEEKFKNLDLLAYRADQVYSWVTKGAVSFDSMTNIPKKEKDFLKKHFYIDNITTEKVLTSKKKDGTKKYLFKLRDGELVESVLMKYKYGYTACISTQVGCKMGCKFCATGKSGFTRNLTAGEMLMQIQKINTDNNIRISRIVLMGMGEPLDNYNNVLKFLKIVSDENSLNISKRNISLSTCGIVDKIRELSKENMPITLSVSLHASNDEIRNKIMPVNRRYNIKELLLSCKDYVNKTGRRISFEYTLISGLNDSYNCAIELSNKLKGLLCYVNLISLNKTFKEFSYNPASNETLYKFKSVLLNKGINATIRRSLGEDIEAACGQLRNRKILK